MLDTESYLLLKKFYKANKPLRKYYDFHEDNKLIQILYSDKLLEFVPIEGEFDSHGGQMYYTDRLQISDLGIKTFLQSKEGNKRWSIPMIISSFLSIAAIIISLLALLKP